jgi:hypothetical protein
MSSSAGVGMRWAVAMVQCPRRQELPIARVRRQQILFSQEAIWTSQRACQASAM